MIYHWKCGFIRERQLNTNDEINNNNIHIKKERKRSSSSRSKSTAQFNLNKQKRKWNGSFFFRKIDSGKNAESVYFVPHACVLVFRFYFSCHSFGIFFLFRHIRFKSVSSETILEFRTTRIELFVFIHLMYSVL